MRLSLNIQSFENKNNNYFVDTDHFGRNNWTFTMNSLFKISYGLFALVLLSAYLGYMTATFLLFTAGVLVLALGVYVNDFKNNDNRR